MTTYHSVTDKIQELLKEREIKFRTFEHEPVRTSEEAAALRPGYTINQGAKTIIVKVKYKGGEKEPAFTMLVVPAGKRFDEHKVKKELAVKSIRFATEDEVLEITGGVQPGGVPPFGNLFGLEVYIDRGLFDNSSIVFNAGDKRFSIAMGAEDYMNLKIGRGVDIV